ncbi:MAG TPA: protoporphyrinogen oxidase, partial [Pyrinomonadaceae bacterium]|nr:protoporphyrinogen oxidase [Pyrinomonadaceae bacterium]
VLTDKLAQCISEFAADLSRGASDNESGIQLKAPVESITLVPRPADSGEHPEWRIHTGNGRTLEADAVCLALPAYSSARLIRGVHQKLASELDEISYASSVTINLAYKRDDIPHPLNGFGFVVPFIEKRSLIACTFSSVKFAGRAPQGYALLRVFAGGALQPEMFQLSEDELVRRVRGDLRDLLAIERTPLFAEVSKWKQSMPQYHVGHLERVRRIEACVAGLPRLVLAGNAYSGLGIPDCIRSGEAAADFLAALD